MSDALKARETAARKEYPETKAAFDRVRAALAGKMFETQPGETAKREEFYRFVHVLDQVQSELLSAMGQGSQEIEAYIDGLTEQP